MGEKSFIRKYVNADCSKKVDMIVKHYPEFMGIVDGYTEGLRYMIQAEKESNRRQEMGELGVRIQSGSVSDPTAKKAIQNVMTREAIIKCDFSGGVMEGVDCAEEYIKEAYLLREMRSDYALFQNQLTILGTRKQVFEQYLNGEISLCL